MARLHWPVLDCVLQPEDILVGQPLNLFHLNMVIDGAADEKTRAWLQEKSLPGADKVVKPAPPPKVLSTLQAEEAAKSGRDAAAAASSSEPLAFFLGGPRPQRAARHELGEEDEGASLKLMRDRASAWPALRGEKAVYGSGRMPPLPSELAKQAKALTYGRDTRLVFFARVVGESGAAAEASAAFGRQAARAQLLHLRRYDVTRRDPRGQLGLPIRPRARQLEREWREDDFTQAVQGALAGGAGRAYGRPHCE